MNYYININGKTAGPFTIDQVKALYTTGQVNGSNQYMADGSKDWMPLSLLASTFTYSPPPCVNYPKSRGIYIILALFFGCFGVHNLYAGRYRTGGIQILVTILGMLVIIGPLITAVWSLIECFTVTTDGKGQPLA